MSRQKRGGVAFTGAIIGGLIGLRAGAGGVISGAIIGGLIGEYLEEEARKRRNR